LPKDVTKEAIAAKKEALNAARVAAKRAERAAIRATVNALIEPKIQAALSGYADFEIDVDDLVTRYGVREITPAVDGSEYVGALGGFCGTYNENEGSFRLIIPWDRLLDKVQDE
jgi:hypothetical protein